MGMYFTFLGVVSLGIKKSYWKIIILFVILFFSIALGGFLGLRLCVNYIFFYPCFTTNSLEGSLFLTLNLIQWSILIGLSFLGEGEKE